MHLPVLFITEKRRHGYLVKLNRNAGLYGDTHSLLVADGSRPRRTLNKRQRPIIAVIRDPQIDLGRLDAGDCILHHLPHFVDRRHCHGRTISVAPFVGHEQNTVSRLSQQPVVLSLIEKTGLGIRSLGRQSHRHMIAVWGKKVPDIRHKIGERKPVLRPNVFKVDIHSLKVLLLNGGQQIRKQVVFGCRIIHHGRDQSVIEITVRPERRQRKNRPHTRLQRSTDHESIVRRRHDQFSLRGKSVRKNRERRKIQKRFIQNALLNKRIGIAVHPGRIGRHGSLPRR